MRFPRMTTRRWLVVVALLALVLASGLEAWRLGKIARVRWQAANDLQAWELKTRASIVQAHARAKDYRASAERLRRETFPEYGAPVPVSISGPGIQVPEFPTAWQERRDRWLAYQQRELGNCELLAANADREAVRLTQEADRLARSARRFREAAPYPWRALPPE